MLELILLVTLCVLVGLLSRPFSQGARFTIWTVAVIWTAATIIGHGWIASYDGIGIVQGDSSVDAWNYYETAIDIQGDISSRSIAASSGSVQHLGYWYVNAAAVSISSRPMLALRLFKVTLFMVALLCLARMWRSWFGEWLAILGLLYLSLGYWETFYNNFRNFKDGIILSLVMLLFVAVEHARRPTDSQLTQRSSWALLWNWLVIASLLVCLFQFRSYLAISMTACICLAVLTMKYKINLSAVVGIIAVGGLCWLIVMLFDKFSGIYFAIELVERIISKGPIEIGENIIRSIAGPIPWQHSKPFLIPSHCAYLILLPLAVYACVTRFRGRMLWQILFVVSIFMFGALLDDAGWRKRLPVIPFLVSWVLTDLFQRQQARRSEDI